MSENRELGPDVSDTRGIPLECPLCGSRTLQAPTRDPEDTWCPECGYVDAEGQP